MNKLLDKMILFSDTEGCNFFYNIIPYFPQGFTIN